MYMETDLDKKITDVVEWLQKEFSSIRTGQASPALLDSVLVESYGARVPLQQVASVGVEDARTLRISPWDASTIPGIETAIRDADLGVSLATDSSGLRVIFPDLTTERREQLVKLAKAKLEEARVSVRGVRDEVMKDIDRRQKSGEISEDEKFTQKEAVQSKTEKSNSQLDALFAEKDKALRI
jgi:ribosome recycling factor